MFDAMITQLLGTFIISTIAFWEQQLNETTESIKTTELICLATPKLVKLCKKRLMITPAWLSPMVDTTSAGSTEKLSMPYITPCLCSLHVSCYKTIGIMA